MVAAEGETSTPFSHEIAISQKIVRNMNLNSVTRPKAEGRNLKNGGRSRD